MKGWLFLEESSAESIVKRYLIPWFAPRLAGQVKTVACNGTSKVEPKFEDFDRLFLFLHLEPMYRNRVWVIVDGDPSGQQVVEALRKRYVSGGWAEDTFSNFSKHNFEEYYPDRFDSDREEALGKRDAQAKRTAKRELLEKVLAWIDADPEQARVEFEESANEVIARLKEIESKI